VTAADRRFTAARRDRRLLRRRGPGGRTTIEAGRLLTSDENLNRRNASTGGGIFTASGGARVRDAGRAAGPARTGESRTWSGPSGGIAAWSWPASCWGCCSAPWCCPRSSPVGRPTPRPSACRWTGFRRQHPGPTGVRGDRGGGGHLDRGPQGHRDRSRGRRGRGQVWRAEAGRAALRAVVRTGCRGPPWSRSPIPAASRSWPPRSSGSTSPSWPPSGTWPTASRWTCGSSS
jgi:hypothetical protein